jgi:hypothetical protein
MKAMGLPISFTSSLVINYPKNNHEFIRSLFKIERSKPHRQTRSQSPGNKTIIHSNSRKSLLIHR